MYGAGLGSTISSASLLPSSPSSLTSAARGDRPVPVEIAALVIGLKSRGACQPARCRLLLKAKPLPGGL
jgi:hypothetical protein